MLHIKVGYFYVGLHGLKIWQGNLINSFQKHTTGIRIRITKKKNWLSDQTRIGSVQTTHYSSICDLKIYDSFREQIHEYHEKKIMMKEVTFCPHGDTACFLWLFVGSIRPWLRISLSDSLPFVRCLHFLSSLQLRVIVYRWGHFTDSWITN